VTKCAAHEIAQTDPHPETLKAPPNMPTPPDILR
jgi:hypothetical protein